ncbi:hypothetical protein LXL04_001622 [Taraxacum kok-saghyz]
MSFKTPPKNYRDVYEDVDEEFSTVIIPQNDNKMPSVDPLDLGKESRNGYFRTVCRDTVIRKVVGSKRSRALKNCCKIIKKRSCSFYPPDFFDTPTISSTPPTNPLTLRRLPSTLRRIHQNTLSITAVNH